MIEMDILLQKVLLRDNLKLIDPLGQPTVTAGSVHCFRTCCPSVRPSPLFKSSKKQQQKNMLVTGETVGLAE